MNRNQWLREVVKPQLVDVTTAIEVGVWRGEYSQIIMQTL